MRDTPRSTNIWNMSEARAKLSEVLDRTLTEGPQELHRRGDVVVFISKAALEEKERAKQKWDEDQGRLTSSQDERHESTSPETIPGEWRGE